jgi:hypothetical protein
MAAACVTQALPAASWRATAGRGSFTRNGAILALAVAVHVAAAAVLTHASPEHRAAPRSGPATIAMRLIAAETDKQAPTLAPTTLSTRAPVNAPVRSQTSRSADPAPRDDPERATNSSRDADSAAAPATVREPDPQLARRSLAFGGSSAQRDETGAPRGSARPLAGWLQEGIARSVWPVALDLASAGDGVCRVVRGDARIACAHAALDTALARIPEDMQRALVSWVQSGLVQEIEIRIENGAAHYSLRAD